MTLTDIEFNPYRPQPLLIVISGPSGVGKDSVVEKMKMAGQSFYFVVTMTDRPRRDGETEGVDYYFVSTAEFERMIEEGGLIEYACVYGQYKGIPKEQVRQALESGKDVVMRIDVQGAASIRALYPQAVQIFLVAESKEELITRLVNRKTDSEENIRRRTETALEEMERVTEFDYVVPNRDNQLEQTVAMISAIIQAEHCRVEHRQVNL